jgi:hypothetical protein
MLAHAVEHGVRRFDRIKSIPRRAGFVNEARK